MKKKSNEKKYNSKFILEELEPRQLFSGGAEGVIPPPPVAPEAAVINADIEPVVESQNPNDVTAIPNPDSAVELTNPGENTSPILTLTAGSTEFKADIGGNESPLLTETETETQEPVSLPENEGGELASSEQNTDENTEILLVTDCPIAIENLSE